MVEQKKISRETYRQIRAALIFLYKSGAQAMLA